MKRGILLLAAALVLAACGGEIGEAPEIQNARLGQPTGPNAAMYFTAVGYGVADRLVGATTDVADSVDLHGTLLEDGIMTMRHLDSLELPENGELVLSPGGFHLMLLDAERLDVGETVEVTIEWENAGEMVIDVVVVSPGDVGE